MVKDIFVLSSPTIGKCNILPENNIWNTPIDQLPVHSNSDNVINGINSKYFDDETQTYKYRTIHPDFGSGTWLGKPIGIPYTMVTNPNQQFSNVIAVRWPDESDNVPMPIPFDALIEGGGDRHVLVLYEPTCTLYELFAATRPDSPNKPWKADNTAVYDLNSNELRPDGWTSADAAGLPILPGLARYEEVANGEINHALRFTMDNTRAGTYQWPARHYASSDSDPKLPKMGDRFRLKASFNIDGQGFGEQTKVILRALKKYGLILADNGSSWYINGVPNPGWDNDQLVEDLQNSEKLKASDFELVDVESLKVDPDSGEAGAQAPTTPKPTNAPTTNKPTNTPTLKPTKTPITNKPTNNPSSRKPSKYPTKKPITMCENSCKAAKDKITCLSISSCKCTFKKKKCVPA